MEGVDERPRAEHERFVRAHTALVPAPFVPEIRLHLATEVTPLWHATAAWLHGRDVPPPFWAFAWAGGQALARHVLDDAAIVRAKSVLDFATGGGIVAIAAARAGAARVVAVDVDPFAAAACAMNARANGVEIEVRCADVVGEALAGADVVLAGDVWYEAAAAARFLPWLRGAARTARVLTGDPGRSYAPTERVGEIASFSVPTPDELEGAPSRITRILAIEP